MAATLWVVVLYLCLHGAPVGSDRAREGFAGKMKQLVKNIKERRETDSVFAQLYNKYVETQQQPPKTLDDSFSCGPLAPSYDVPTSVHMLRPGDVRVVGAVGDSLTAGRGAERDIKGLLFDFPHLSWSIGGEPDVVTIPNILKRYNPNIIGAATGVREWGFNAAVTGAEAENMLDQVQSLVSAMQDEENVDVQNDWKVITMFIGGNDICRMCDDYDYYSPDNYIQRIQSALDYLHDNVPRVFVNLVEVINVDLVQEMGASPFCSLAHRIVCNCAANPENSAAAEKVIEYRMGYQEKVKELVDSGRYDTRKDFTVVVQPFYRETGVPLTDDGSMDLSYFAADCFHHTTKGQQTTAKALWNNMMQPVGAKILNWEPESPLLCPSKDNPYIYTAQNSVTTT